MSKPDVLAQKKKPVPEDVKTRCVQEIAVHLRVHGAQHWDDIRNRYPEVPERTFYRWVHRVRHPKGTTQGELNKVQEDARAEALRMATLATARHVPAVSPAYIMADPAKARRQLNILDEIAALYRDAEKLRASSVVADEKEADGERIKNPMLFEKQINARMKIIETTLAVKRDVADMDAMEEFYQAIVEIVVKEVAPYPDVQKRIIDKLRALNGKRGMTIYAGSD